jgi:hypothetical protein
MAALHNGAVFEIPEKAFEQCRHRKWQRRVGSEIRLI